MPWNRGGNDVVEHCRSVDVRRWHRDGLLIDSEAPDDGRLVRQFNWRWYGHDDNCVASITVGVEPEAVCLKYRYRVNGDDWRQVNAPIRLTRTPVNFGGKRVWFCCPGCGKRCAKIYIHGQPACRTCKHLTYGCQVEKPYEQHLRQSQKIEDIIEARGGVVSHGDIDRKPPTMHWRTFDRLRERHSYHQQQSLNIVMAASKGPIQTPHRDA